MQNWKKFKVELTTEAPFRIGGVRPIPGTTDVDSSVVKLGNKIVIQGTSLKGTFRAELERFLIDNYFKDKKRWHNPWMKPCIPADVKTISPDEKQLLNKGFYKYSCSYPKSDDYICPVCYLLCARGLVGYARIPFLNLIKGGVEQLQFIREDRIIGTSARGERGALGKFEAIPADSKFEGYSSILEVDDITGWRLGEKRSLAESQGDRWLESGLWNREKILKELVIERLISIKTMGGFRSKGFGDVKIIITSS